MSKRKLIRPLSKEDDERALQRWRHSPRTQAVRVLAADATDEEWLATRRAGIGASELGSVLAVPGAYSSPFALWWAKHLDWDSTQTFAMKVGHKLEPVIAELFADERPDLLVCRPDGRLWQHPDVTWMLATPDYLAATEGGRVEPVECKSDEGGRGWGPAGSDKVPLKHWIQVQVQCAVFGAERGHLVRLAGKRMSLYVVEAASLPWETWDTWVAAGNSFMVSLEVGAAPDPDGHDATEDALERLYPAMDMPAVDGSLPTAYIDDDLANAYLRAHDAKEAANSQFALLRNRVREQLGRSRLAARRSDAVVVAERRQYKKPGYEVGPHAVDEIRRRLW